MIGVLTLSMFRVNNKGTKTVSSISPKIIRKPYAISGETVDGDVVLVSLLQTLNTTFFNRFVDNFKHVFACWFVYEKTPLN